QNLLYFIAYFVSLLHLLSLTDKAATTLLYFFNMVLPLFSSDASIAVTPSTVKKANGFDEYSSQVKRIVVCPECHKLYDMNREQIPATCNYVRYPNHPRANHRQACGHSLFKDARKQWPYKEYAYNSLKAHIKHLFAREGFEKSINLWRNRQVEPNIYSDVYNGKMWHGIPDPDDDSYSYVQHGPFRALNPFENSAYSCGAMYLTINNLPCTERFK
ncbi:hypothetical protein BJV82DRAFT_486738, partial [Fennellomyces sp. T-0311]